MQSNIDFEHALNYFDDKKTFVFTYFLGNKKISLSEEIHIFRKMEI